jgi:hypothetical protein
MSARRFIWGAIIVIFGALLLAANFGWVGWTFVLSLWRLWPLILVLIGIGLLFRDRNQTLGAALMLVVVLAGVGLCLLSYNGVVWGQLTTTDIASPSMSGITSGRAEIEIGAAKLTVSGGDTGAAVTGRVTSHQAPETTFDQPVNGVFHFKVSQKWQNFVGLDVGGEETLDLQLDTTIPWSIDVRSGASDMNVDLSRVRLAAFNLSTGASSLKLRVGQQVEPGASVIISGGAASYDISLPRSLNLTVETATGLTVRDFDSGFQKTGDTWRWNGGGGNLRVEVRSGVSTLRVHLY